MATQKVSDVISKLKLEKMAVSPDGRLLIDGKDIVDHLKAAGINLPAGIRHPLNYVQCNLSGCGTI